MDGLSAFSERAHISVGRQRNKDCLSLQWWNCYLCALWLYPTHPFPHMSFISYPFSQWSLQPLTYGVIKPQGAITFRTIIFPRLSHSQWCQTTPNWRISSGFTIFQLLPPLARDLKREQRGCWIAVNAQLFPHFKTWKRVRVAYCGASNNFSPFGSILLPGIILKSHCMPPVSFFKWLFLIKANCTLIPFLFPRKAVFTSIYFIVLDFEY